MLEKKKKIGFESKKKKEKDCNITLAMAHIWGASQLFFLMSSFLRVLEPQTDD